MRWRSVDSPGSQASSAARGWVCGEGLWLQRRLSPALPQPRSAAPGGEGKGLGRAGGNSRPGLRRDSRGHAADHGVAPELGTRVVCHCSPRPALPSPGGQRTGSAGSAAATLPVLGSGRAGWGQENVTAGCGALWSLVWGVVGGSSAASPSPTPSLLFPSLSLIPSFRAHPPF